jgi:cytochrome P450
MLGEGMLYSEGAKWKHRRRLISNAFNFELLKNNIPKICNICDKKIYAIEEESKIKDG